MAAAASPWKPAPSAGVLAGIVVATIGYLLPWFKLQEGYSWWVSGLEYLTLSTGGGWTIWTLPMLALALIAGLYAGRSAVAGGVALVGVVAAAFLALVVVAGSFALVPAPSALNTITELPFAIGIPLMAVGFGIAAVGGVVAVIEGG